MARVNLAARLELRWNRARLPAARQQVTGGLLIGNQRVGWCEVGGNRVPGIVELTSGVFRARGARGRPQGRGGGGSRATGRLPGGGRLGCAGHNSPVLDCFTVGIHWEGTAKRESLPYTCGFCGREVAAQAGWSCLDKDGNSVGEVRICHLCYQPTFFKMPTGYPRRTIQVPKPLPGEDVEHVPDDVKTLYDEARHAFTANAYTASVLALRKLLMHVAVEKGAAPGLKFVEYVEYLDQHKYLGADGKDWVDVIRQVSNEANHEIMILSEQDAEHVLSFAEMLLKLLYEFPGRVKPPPPPSKATP